MLDFARARRNMVDNQLRTFDITDRAVLAAMNQVPREDFVPDERRQFAYVDQDIPLETGTGERRWAIQPMVLGRLLQALEVAPGTRVLDVAAGYGYASALFSALGADVVALDSDEALATEARLRLGAQFGGRSPEVRVGPVAEGCPERAPFDVILINGAVERRPDQLLAQLSDGGRLGCLKREGAACHAVLYLRSGQAVGFRSLFDATAPVLESFAREKVFQF
jgi:protein-L-isoaspartate(D-aspartate) O-methyltransferase